MLWLKSFHIIFVVSWFAGLFYLPRLFVNHAMTHDAAVAAQLALMERKLYRFITPLAVFAVLTGMALWLGFGFAGTWLWLKLGFVTGLVAYHIYCGYLLRAFQRGENRRGHIWYRWFNEIPVLVLIAVVLLVVLKPDF